MQIIVNIFLSLSLSFLVGEEESDLPRSAPCNSRGVLVQMIFFGQATQLLLNLVVCWALQNQVLCRFTLHHCNGDNRFLMPNMMEVRCQQRRVPSGNLKLIFLLGYVQIMFDDDVF